MTVFIEEPTATLTEIAKRAKLTPAEVRAEAEQLGMFVGVNWAGEDSLSTKDAHRLVDGSARRDQEHQNAFQAHIAALQQWQTGHEDVRREAWQIANNEAMRAGVSPGLS
jgi:hypothetical protein